MEKIIIVTFLIIYLSIEASGAAILAIGGPFKCGELECPNGSICEIIQKPSDDFKSVKITTQCKSVAGEILDEVIRTKEVLAGQIPVTSIQKKSFSGGVYRSSSFFGGTSGGATIGDRTHGDDTRGDETHVDGTYGVDGAEDAEEELVEFVPLDSDNEMDIDIDAGSSTSASTSSSDSFDKIWSVFDKQKDIFRETTNFINKMFSNWFGKSL